LLFRKNGKAAASWLAYVKKLLGELFSPDAELRSEFAVVKAGVSSF